MRISDIPFKFNMLIHRIFRNNSSEKESVTDVNLRQIAIEVPPFAPDAEVRIRSVELPKGAFPEEYFKSRGITLVNRPPTYDELMAGVICLNCRKRVNCPNIDQKFDSVDQLKTSGYDAYWDFASTSSYCLDCMVKLSIAWKS